MRETEKIDCIFNREFDPQEAGRRLLEVLISPSGMEEFVHKYNGKLSFSPVIVGDFPSFLVYSSMTSNKGEFVPEEGGTVWHDLETGKQIPCFTMVLNETVGRAMRATYRHELAMN